MTPEQKLYQTMKKERGEGERERERGEVDGRLCTKGGKQHEHHDHNREPETQM